MKRMAPLSPLEAGGPIRATVCLFGSFVSGPRFLRYETSLVSGFEFRIRVSFPKLKKKQFRIPFQNNELRRIRNSGGLRNSSPTKNPRRVSYPSFVSEFRKMNCSA